MEDITTLQRLTEHIPELSSLPAATSYALLREAGLETCSGESVLYQEGDRPTCFYLLLAGHVSIHTKSASSAFYDAEAKGDPSPTRHSLRIQPPPPACLAVAQPVIDWGHFSTLP